MFINFVLFLGTIADFILGTFVFLKRNKDESAFTFSLICLWVGLWAIGIAIFRIVSDIRAAYFWNQEFIFTAGLIPMTFVQFVHAFINKPFSKQQKFVLYIPSVIILIGVIVPGVMIREIVIREWGKESLLGYAYPYYGLYFTTFMSYGFWRLIRTFINSEGLYRLRIKYIFLGTFISSIVGAYFNLYLILLGQYKYIWVGPFCSFILVTIIAYAILRYRLMDITLAFSRAGVFLIVYTLVLGIPFIVLRRTGSGMIATSLAVILATLGPLTYNYLRNRTEKVIFKERRRYQEILINLSKSMVDIRDIEELFKTINSAVVDAVKIKFAVIYLKEEGYKSFQLKSCYPQEAKSRFPELITIDDPLIGILNQRKKPLLSEEIVSQNKVDPNLGLIIPCFGKDGFLGFIALGAKQNNHMYTNDDILSFENLSYATSLAVENCTYWKEIEDRQRKARLQEMDTFSYSLAHEIDNPMTIVYNLARFQKEHFLKYITDPQERKDAEEACDIMMEGSGRVMSMVKAIRQFGQKVSGELEPLHLQEIIEGFSRLYSPELKANCVQFLKEMPEEPIYVKGVAAELQQVLMIFAKNAIHAMKISQEKKLTLKVTRVNHATVRIALSDTGYGVKKGNLETIFAPFFTSKASTEGTGMGLHNAKGFILRHNGRIWAESDGEGKGSTFIVELPVIESIKPESTKKEEGKTKWVF